LNNKKHSSRNQQVLFINAEEQSTSKVRSQHYLTQDNIETIVAMYERSSTDTDDVKIAKLPEIIENEFNLNPNQYFTSQTVETQFSDVIINKAVYDEKVKNKRTLKEIAQLSRGVNLPSKNTIKEGQKGYKVIQLKDVEDGKIDLEGIEEIPVKN